MARPMNKFVKFVLRKFVGTPKSKSTGVVASPSVGLVAPIRPLKHLCRDDPTALAAIDKVTVGRQGELTNLVDNVSTQTDERPDGNSNMYALRKLRKDRPDLHERMAATPTTAALLVGSPLRARDDTAA